VVVMMVAIGHVVVARHVMVVAHDLVMMMVVVMMMDRLRRGHAGRQGEGNGRRQRQDHEFQGLPPDLQGPIRYRGTRLAWPPQNCRDGKGSPGNAIQV
jgi:hypothetical protein